MLKSVENCDKRKTFHFVIKENKKMFPVSVSSSHTEEYGVSATTVFAKKVNFIVK